MAVRFLDAPTRVKFLDEEPEVIVPPVQEDMPTSDAGPAPEPIISGSLSGSEPLPPGTNEPRTETPTLAQSDPRLQEIMTGVQASQAVLHQFLLPSKLDWRNTLSHPQLDYQARVADAAAAAAAQKAEQIDPMLFGEKFRANLERDRLAERAEPMMAFAEATKPLSLEEKQARNVEEVTQRLAKDAPQPPTGITTLARGISGLLSQLAAIPDEFAESGFGPAGAAMRGLASDLGKFSQVRTGVSGDIERGIGNVGALLAGNPAGKIGIGVAALRGALQTHSEVLEQGGSKAEADEAARESVPALALFMLAGAGAGKLASDMISKNASAVQKGLAAFVGAEVANIGSSAVLRALEGGGDVSIESLTADTLFALLPAHGAYKKASAEAVQKAKTELLRRGFSEEQIKKSAANPIGETPADALVKPDLKAAQERLNQIEQELGPREEWDAKEGRPVGRRNLTVEEDRLLKQIEEGNAEALKENTPPRERAPEVELGGIILTLNPDGTVKKAASLETPAAEASSPPAELSIHDVVPSIRVNGETVKGQKGDPSHNAIYDRWAAEHGDPKLTVFDKFDHPKENPNFFSVPKSKEFPNGEMSRDQLEAKFGIRSAQRLLELQQKTPQPEPSKSAGPGAPYIGEIVPPEPIGAYNAKVDEQMKARGLKPLMSEARKVNTETWDKLSLKNEEDPSYAPRLVEEIETGKKKILTDEEQGTLLWQQVDLRNKRDTAAERAADEKTYSPEERAEFDQEAYFYEKELQRNEVAGRQIGTEWGRSGQFRRQLAASDYTLASMESRARVAKGDSLTAEERATIAEQQKGIAETQKGLDAKQEQAEETASLEAAKATLAAAAKIHPKVLKYAEGIVSRWEAEAIAARKELREAMGMVSANPFQTKVAGAVFKMARAKVARGLLNAADFVNEMVTEFGEKVRSFIQPAWDRAVRMVGGLDATKTRQKTPKQAASEKAAGEEAASTEAGIKAVVEGGEKNLDKLAPLVKRLAKEYIRAGEKTVEGLETRLENFFKPLLPEVTKRQLRDAFSDYGKSKAAPTDPLKITASQLRTESQKLSALEALLAKQAPLRTGQQRAEQSDRSRALQKQINQLKKELGIVEGDPAKRLKSALETMQTRTQNRINDLRFEIAKGERTVKNKTAAPTGPKLEALKAELAKVEAEHDAVFGKRKITEEQRLKAAISAATRAEQAANAELANAKKGIFTKSAPKGVTRSAELEAIRARATAAREELKTLKDAEFPERAERTAIQTRKAQLARSNADLKDRLAAGDFAPAKKRPPVDLSKDPEAVKLKTENEKLKSDFERARFEDQQRNRTLLEKGKDAIKETLGASRSLITAGDVSAPLRQGGFLLLGDLIFHPIRAAKQIAGSFRDLVSQKGFDENQARIALRPNADLYRSSKLYFSDLNSKLSAREENMRSILVEKIPVIGRIIRASNRAYSGFLNRQRADTMDAFVDAMGGKEAITPEGATFLADAVNVLTGRGKVGAKNEAAANWLARYIFSPRFFVSRLQTLLGHPITNGMLSGPKLGAERAIIALQYAKFAVAVGAIMGLAQLNGAKVNLNPTSSDFLKIRIGDTRIDVLSGLQQLTVFLTRVGKGKLTNTGGEQKPTDAGTLGYFLRSKLAPVPGAIVDHLSGKNIKGEKATIKGTAQNLTIPMSYQDVKKLYREHGPIGGTALEILSLMGAGVNSFRK